MAVSGDLRSARAAAARGGRTLARPRPSPPRVVFEGRARVVRPLAPARPLLAWFSPSRGVTALFERPRYGRLARRWPLARPVPGRRRGEPRRSFSSRSGGSGEAWRDAIRPVKSAAAKGVNSDALRVAVRNFSTTAADWDGFPPSATPPSRHRLRRPALMRAVNRPPDTPRGEPSARLSTPPRPPPHRRKDRARRRSRRQLAAYTKARLADERVHRQRQRRLKTLAHVLQEGGNHAPPPRWTRSSRRRSRASETRRATCLATLARSARW